MCMPDEYLLPKIIARKQSEQSNTKSKVHWMKSIGKQLLKSQHIHINNVEKESEGKRHIVFLELEYTISAKCMKVTNIIVTPEWIPQFKSSSSCVSAVWCQTVQPHFFSSLHPFDSRTKLIKKTHWYMVWVTWGVRLISVYMPPWFFCHSTSLHFTVSYWFGGV